ncbi:MAG: TonB-dependent receptor [Bacteroidota bacterium]
MKKLLLLSLIVIACSSALIRGNDLPEKSYTLSGHIRDSETGEELIGATVYVKELGDGTVTNAYGFYSISLAEGSYSIAYSYVGYRTKEFTINFSTDIVKNVELEKSASELEEVVVSTEKKNINITSLEMGTSKLPIESIRQIPAFMGEVDVIKAIQLLPGVQSASEGSSGFSVRGGGTDQNLILLDEATVYNASHLLGFFSVFNNDAVKDVKLYKGDIPARYGGRLSSLLDVRMKDGNLRRFSGSGGVGTISSRLTLEGPIIKDKTSFLMAGRRTYADLFLPLSKNEEIRESELFFYDLNGKVNHIINDNNRIFLSGYFGRDVFANQFASMKFGNKTMSFRWNHLFSKKLFSNFSFIYSAYDYELGTPEDQPSAFRWKSSLNNYGFKADFNLYANPLSTFYFGISSVYHVFSPGIAKGIGEETIFNEFKVPDNYALEHGVYAMGEEKIGYRWSVKYGIRLSGFQNIGDATVYDFDKNYEVVDSSVYERREFFNNFFGLEPRLGVNFTLNDNNSLKASYSRTRQYLQLAKNSTAGTPLDIWFSASPNIKPQIADQVSLGIFKNFRQHTIETSVETYYKYMKNTIDFRDHAQLLLNPQLEGEVRTGNSWSYGLEFLVRLTEEKISGWVSYTLSKTRRQIESINNGEPYDAPYDKPHDVSVVFNYRINNAWSVGANWVFSSGLPYTFPTGRYEILGKILPVYSDRNAYRFDNYHRLDFSVNYKIKKPGRRWISEWNISVYNVYGRKNTWAINFVQEENNPNRTYAEKTYLFSVIPAITYNFKF